ncbi:hypothetical protein CR513_52787, partial [Mucuna pruriens]
MKRKGEQYAKHVYLINERFSYLRKSKLLHRGDGPFKIIKRINDNGNSFNVIDLTPFDIGTQAPNLRPNSLQEMDDDAYMEDHSHIPYESFK